MDDKQEAEPAALATVNLCTGNCPDHAGDEALFKLHLEHKWEMHRIELESLRLQLQEDEAQ